MPQDSKRLRDNLTACYPSLVIDDVAKESGQRVVYYAHFDDSLIPHELLEDDDSKFLKGWHSWGCVVVKVVAGADEIVVTRLLAEANLLKEINSNQFPRLWHSDYISENPITEEPLSEKLFISIEEFIASVPLSGLLNSYIGKPEEVFAIAKKVVEGLRPLWEHSRKLVHRDVKPDNLLLTSNGEVVIIDFGIIRETGSQGVTREGWGNAPFTPGYGAPEQIANDKDLVSFKTDLFSLGVVMYQLISGIQPFFMNTEMSIYDVLQATIDLEPATLEELGVANKTQSLLVAQMMEKKPYLRPRNIDKLLKNLT